jgi:hypothetical protein
MIHHPGAVPNIYVPILIPRGVDWFCLACMGRFWKAPKLTVYDISHRIGAYFGKAPERVYLHAGVRVGARALGIGGDSFDPKILPKPFARLTPSEIEDCLCIYKDELLGGARDNFRRSSGCAVPRRPRS